MGTQKNSTFRSILMLQYSFDHRQWWEVQERPWKWRLRSRSATGHGCRRSQARCNPHSDFWIQPENDSGLHSGSSKSGWQALQKILQTLWKGFRKCEILNKCNNNNFFWVFSCYIISRLQRQRGRSEDWLRERGEWREKPFLLVFSFCHIQRSL